MSIHLLMHKLEKENMFPEKKIKRQRTLFIKEINIT